MIIREGSTGKITGRIVDSDGVGVAGTDLLTFTFTLYDYVTDVIINSNNAKNVLNANGATVSSSPGTEGNFVIPLAVLDNVILNTDRMTELHVALFRFTALGVAGSGELQISVKNIRKIT